MAEALSFNLLALSIAGDLGDYTLYQHKKRGLVAYPKSPPLVPNTAAQAAQRQRFTQAVRNWQATSVATRTLFEQVSQRLRVPMTGHNIWLHLSFSQDEPLRRTLEHQAMLPLPLPMPPLV